MFDLIERVQQIIFEDKKKIIFTIFLLGKQAKIPVIKKRFKGYKWSWLIARNKNSPMFP